jgi:hypothetical protein
VTVKRRGEERGKAVEVMTTRRSRYIAITYPRMREVAPRKMGVGWR